MQKKDWMNWKRRTLCTTWCLTWHTCVTLDWYHLRLLGKFSRLSPKTAQWLDFVTSKQLVHLSVLKAFSLLLFHQLISDVAYRDATIIYCNLYYYKIFRLSAYSLYYFFFLFLFFLLFLFLFLHFVYFPPFHHSFVTGFWS